MVLKGIDVSGFQSLAALAAVIDRYDWIGVKATEGLHSVNPLHAQQVALARSKGKGVLHYHYFHPSESASAQWAWFRQNARWQPGDMLALDLETQDGVGMSGVAAGAAAFLQAGRASSGAAVWIYLNQWWRSQVAATASGRVLEGFPLWLADYTRDPSKLGAAAPWPNLTCEQWTDNDHGTGIDGDVFLGGWAVWAKLAVPGVTSKSTIWRWLVAAGVVLAGGTGVVTGAPAPSPKPPVSSVPSRPSVPSGGHSGTPAPVPAPKPGPKPVKHPTPHPVCGCPHQPVTSYRVRPGDSLDSIARAHGTTWQHLARVNGLAHPDVIYPGQTIRISGVAAPAVHAAAVHASVWVRVQPGDTLDGIARRHGTSWLALARLNRLADPNLIYPGRLLRVH